MLIMLSYFSKWVLVNKALGDPRGGGAVGTHMPL